MLVITMTIFKIITLIIWVPPEADPETGPECFIGEGIQETPIGVG